MAHKKGAGSSRNGRDSVGQRLGMKTGAGALSFRREKYVPRGGPDGGSGGRGGNIILEVSRQLNSLQDYRFKHHFVAGRGGRGGGSRRHGRDANDLILQVPPGTLVKDE